MKRKKELLFYSLIFLFFVILFFYSPISGDDWGNYLVGKTGIYHSFGNALGMYFSWEGRIVSRILINILTYHKILWNFTNSFIMISIIFLIVKLIKPKNKLLIMLLSLFLLLGMNLYTFSQVVVWLAGNITYLFVIPILLFYFYEMFNNKKKSKYMIIILSVINIISTMFIEHMAIILIFSNIFFLIYYYIKNKAIDKTIILYLILSIISTLFMFLSPGTRLRSGMENIEFNKLSLFGKVLYNIPNFIYYTFISNYTLMPILIISSIYLIKNVINNNIIRYIHYVLLIFPLFTMISSILSFLSISSIFSNQNSLINIIYYIILSIDLFILYILYTKKYNSIKPLFFFSIGLLSTGIMMLSPTWGYRVSIASFIFISISSFMIIDKFIKYRSIYNYLIGFINLCFIIFFSILYYSVHLQYMDNYKTIQEGIKSNSKVITIKEYPSFVNCNINPTNEYHLTKFKEYYGISKDTRIVLLKNDWKFKIIYKK